MPGAGARAPAGWNHLVYAWCLRDKLPALSIPLLGADQAVLDLQVCFDVAYDGTGAEEEAGYEAAPRSPPLVAGDAAWVEARLRERGMRK